MKTLVTGANGHLGYTLCRALRERGHAVRASVRAVADESRTRPLRALGDIEIVEIDNFRGDQFRAALDGIDAFFHLAAVYAYVVERGGEDDLIRSSVEGAANAIRAAADAGTRKVVLASSVVTLPLVAPGAPPSTEADWAEDQKVPYFRAKIEAERKAWALASELGVPLVTVLPGAIGGPSFIRSTATIDIFEGIMLGTLRMGAPDANFPYVDVRDVAAALILAGEADCTGRFIVCNDRFPSFMELTRMMNAIDPAIPRAMMVMPGFMAGAAPLFDALSHRLRGSPRTLTPELVATLRGKTWSVSNERIKRELGWRQAIPIETSLSDMIEAIKARRAGGQPRAA